MAASQLLEDSVVAPTLASTPEEQSKSEAPCKCCKTPNNWSPFFLIYLLSFLGHWGDRKWMFTAGIVLVQITPSSLRLIGIYYACVSVFIIMFSPMLGAWIDKTARLRAALSCLVAQNSLVAISGGCFLVVLQIPFLTNSNNPNNWLGWLIVSVAIVSAASAAVASSGSQTCLTKDWMVEVCGGDTLTLAKCNSINRAIDLGTEVLCPSFVGYLMAVINVSVGALIIVVWNIISLFAEAALYYRIHMLCDSIRLPKQAPTVVQDRGSTHNGSLLKAIGRRCSGVYSSWHLYMTHVVRSAGLGLAFLYMTVLSIDNYSIAYLYESGLNPGVLGIFTSLSSVPGLIGSLLFPKLRQKIGLERVGLLGFTWLVSSLTLCVASVFAPGSLFYLVNETPHNSTEGLTVPSTAHGFNDSIVFLQYNSSDIDSYSAHNTTTTSYSSTTNYTSVGLLLAGIIISRFGLWTADLSVTQSMQELVESNKRGAINGVQSGMNMFFDLFRSVLLIASPRMDRFGIMIILSFIFICMGLCSYVHFYCQRKKSREEVKVTQSPDECTPAEQTPLNT